MAERRAPAGRGREKGSITWTEHVKAYEAYSARYGTEQSVERIAERGGFGLGELRTFLGHESNTFILAGHERTDVRP